MKMSEDNSKHSIADLIAKKQSDAERKSEYFRNLSDADRQALNERSAEICEQIASEFSKKSRRLKIS